ncbi:MAG: bifunctional adenosylcobinamide kinase/adenosylcobinamide-phosphate guanylyltransferase [Clostridium sp.]
MILVTGGARSGKSSYGESLIKEYNNCLYIATSIPFDEEMKERVKRHRLDRPSHWDTLEAYKDFDVLLKDKINDYQGIIVDCITIMISNILLENCKNMTHEEFEDAEKIAIEEVDKLLNILEDFQGRAVIVTNEVGFGVVPESRLGRYFRDIAGRVNQLIAKRANEVYLVVSSIPVAIKKV